MSVNLVRADDANGGSGLFCGEAKNNCRIGTGAGTEVMPIENMAAVLWNRENRRI
ncbi:MAG: hypothetical protein WBB22_01480 [Anaerolineae bacterium]